MNVSCPDIGLRLSAVVLLVLIGSLLPVSRAHANGNYSHLWIAVDSLSYLEEGELRDLLTREELRQMLRNGAMFPDGGYALGDNYGEIAHWEPFHLTYLDWIRTTYQPPWSDEAAQHIALLMGMAAHGIADQLYDGMYLKRHEYFDEHGSEATLFGVDGATDACFAATQGPMELPEIWVPAESLAPLFDTLRGYQVSADTIELGQSMVVVAVMLANDSLDDPDVLAEYMETYPWACANQDNPLVPGSPPTHGPAIARYWSVLWARLHGDEAFDKPLLGSFFTGGTPFDQPQDAGTPDSWVSFAMSHGLNPATVTPDDVVVTDDSGQTHPVNLHVYYGHNSHLVNIKPQEDWPGDTLYTVTISPPIASWQGIPLALTHSFTFATMPEPEPAAPDVDIEDVISEPADDTTPETINATVIEEAIETGSPGKGGCSIQDSGEPVPLTAALVLLLLLLFTIPRKERRQ